MLQRLALVLAMLLPLPSGFVAACAKACHDAGSTPVQCFEAASVQERPNPSCCPGPSAANLANCDTTPPTPDDHAPGCPPCCRIACLATLPPTRHVLTQAPLDGGSILPDSIHPKPGPPASVIWEAPLASPSPQRPFERTLQPPPPPVREALCIWIE